MEQIPHYIRTASQFMATGIWRIRLRDQPMGRGFLIRYVRMVLLAFRGFDENRCSLRASALTYYTLLSIVPIAAMAFGIAKGFGFESVLEEELMKAFPNQEEAVAAIIKFARNMLDNTKGGVITGIGIAVLFWTVVKVLGNIESSFNDIWGIKTMRSFGRKFGDYLSVMLIAPVLMIVSSGITVAISSQVGELAERSKFFEILQILVESGLKFVPYFLIWILFSFMYVFMPNQKVKLSSGVVAGVIAGTIYQLLQWGYIYLQVGVANYGAIYGSFAALPLFLVWLQTSWLIVLLGAEISFAHQNVETYEFEPDCMNASQWFRRLMALRIMQLIVHRFVKGETPQTAGEIAHTLGIPIRLVRELIFEMTESQILSEVRQGPGRESGYQPGVDPEGLTLHRVMERLDHRGTEEIPLIHTQEIDRLTASLREFEQVIEKSKSNLRLKEL